MNKIHLDFVGSNIDICEDDTRASIDIIEYWVLTHRVYSKLWFSNDFRYINCNHSLNSEHD